jgi:hypothetical protein
MFLFLNYLTVSKIEYYINVFEYDVSKIYGFDSVNSRVRINCKALITELTTISENHSGTVSRHGLDTRKAYFFL